MTYGDVAPGRMRYIFTTRAGAASKEVYLLEANQVFRPILFGPSPSKWMSLEFQLNRGRFQFQLLETPLADTLRASLENKRPVTALAHQVGILRKVIIRRFAYVALALALIFNVTRFILDGNKSITWFGFLLTLQVYSLIPILPFTGILMWVVMRAYGNAKILALFEQLQQSTTPFDDRDDVDEFDEEAAPPTKDVKLTTRMFKRGFAFDV